MDAKRIGSFIASLRKQKNWTQIELAKRLDVSDKAVSKWESGAGFPDISQLPVLAGLFQITVDELLKGEASAEVGTMSLLETAVKNNSVAGIQKIIANGAVLTRSDEFGKTVLDYALKYTDHALLLFLMEKRLVRIERSFFLTDPDLLSDKDQKELSVYWNDSYRHLYEFDVHHDAIVELLIRAKDYDHLKQVTFLSSGNPGQGWRAPVWIRNGRKILSLSADLLSFLVRDWDPNMLAFLCGFDADLQPDNYARIAQAVGAEGSLEHQSAFVGWVIDYNRRAQAFNAKDQKNALRTVWMETAPIQSWMPEAVLGETEKMAWIAPRLTEKQIGEALFQRIVSKHGASIFGNSPLSHKVAYVAGHASNEEFLSYVRTLYTPEQYPNFPIREVLKRSPVIPDLDQDILVYCLALDRTCAAKNGISISMWPDHDPNRSQKPVTVILKEATDLSFLPASRTPAELWGKGRNLFADIVRYGSDTVLRTLTRVFWTEARVEAMIQLLSGGEEQALCRMITAEKTWQNAEPAGRYGSKSATNQKSNQSLHDAGVLDTLAKNPGMIEKLVDLFDEPTLDRLLNDHCADTDFERMKFLIDHGAMFLTKYSETKDDGEDTSKELVTVRDGKRTAIMREMLKKI